MKKNILILTQPIGLNYGGILQAYALQYYLRTVGFYVETLDWQYYSFSLRWYLSFFKRMIKRIWNKQLGFFPDMMLFKHYKYITANSRKFINDNIRLTTKNYHTSMMLVDSNELLKYDNYICGSDQCWATSKQSQYVLSCMFDFLSSVKDIKRISYAASFGKDEFCNDLNYIFKCKNLLKLFKAVSVRENSAVKLCKNMFDIDAVQVLDPAFLLDAEHYKMLSCNRNDFKIDGNLFVYYLDDAPDKQLAINRIVDIKGLIPFSVLPKLKYSEANFKNLYKCVLPPVEQWLRAFVEAKYVVTDSFHGTVFSILFKRPFIAIGNSSRGMTRFTSLLKLFGLEDRLVLKLEDVTPELINKPIDYERVYAILEAERKKSKKFLMDALNIKK